jgi:hypothetical protein
MRTLLSLFTLLLLTNSYSQSGFCDGWHNGYVEGYCYGVPGCRSALVPVCPVQHVGERDYQAGFNRGVLAGNTARNMQEYQTNQRRSQDARGGEMAIPQSNDYSTIPVTGERCGYRDANGYRCGNAAQPGLLNCGGH